MKRHILIVDDDPLNASTLMDIFNINGYTADTADSGGEALEKIKNQSYQCILSDVRMPGMNGVELLQKVKEIHPGILFVLMTAYANDELLMEGIEAGALVTMIKPLDVRKLLFSISRVLEE